MFDQILYFTAGTLVGLFVSFVTGHRPLIPGDTWRSSGSGTSVVKDHWRGYAPQLALLIVGYCIQAVIRSVVYITGAHQVCYPYFPPPDNVEIMTGWWLTAIFTGIGLIAIFILTIFSDRLSWFLKLFVFTYEDNFMNSYISFYIAGLIFLLLPHAMWSYLVLTPASWTFWVAGALTAIAVLFVWAVFYFVGATWLRLNRTHFSSNHSRTTWGEFCLITGGIHLFGYIWYIIGGQFGDTREDFNTTLYTYLAFTLAILILIYIIIHNQRRAYLKSSSRC